MVIAQIPKMAGFIYALVLFVVAAYLWYAGRWTRTIWYILLIVTIGFGFLILSPIIPYQFQLLVLGQTGTLGAPLVVAIIGIIAILVLSFLFGRHYCGYLCPVGAVQEIAYLVPVPKYVPHRKFLIITIRLIVFGTFILTALLASFGLLFFFGIVDFFKVTLTTATVVFILVIIISVFLYRPFCRLICPFGAIASLAAVPAVFRIRRTGACIRCRKCERACPSDEAGADDAKAECYLCGRCIGICPVKGALMYDRAAESGPVEEPAP